MGFDLDAATLWNGTDAPASAGIDVSLSSFHARHRRQHALLPVPFSMRFHLEQKGGATAAEDNPMLLRLAASLLGVDPSDIRAVEVTHAAAAPRLRVWLTDPARWSAKADALSFVRSNATHQVLDVTLRHECRWWAGDSWQTSGCTTAVDSLTNDVVCTCEHMTSFAVFFTGADSGGVSEEDELALSVISYGGGGISLACLLATAAFFFYHRKRRWVEAHQLIIANLALAMSGMHILFLLAVEPTVVAAHVSCQCVAVLLHYSTLASFAWVAVISINLHKSFMQVMTGRKLGEHGGMLRVAALTWLLPALVVLISTVADRDAYGTPDYCWIDVNSDTLYAFAAPIAALCVINLFVLGAVMRTLGSNVDRRAALKAAVAFFFMLGLGWIFGLVLIVDRYVVWQYLFSTFLAVQGIIIFATQCLGNRRVRQALQKSMKITSTVSSGAPQTDSTSFEHRRNPTWRRAGSQMKTRSRAQSSGLAPLVDQSSSSSRGSVSVSKDKRTSRFNPSSSESGQPFNHQLIQNRARLASDATSPKGKDAELEGCWRRGSESLESQLPSLREDADDTLKITALAENQTPVVDKLAAACGAAPLLILEEENELNMSSATDELEQGADHLNNSLLRAEEDEQADDSPALLITDSRGTVADTSIPSLQPASAEERRTSALVLSLLGDAAASCPKSVV